MVKRASITVGIPEKAASQHIISVRTSSGLVLI